MVAILGATITSWKNKHISTEQQSRMLHLAILTEANGVMALQVAKNSPLAKAIPSLMKYGTILLKEKKSY